MSAAATSSSKPRESTVSASTSLDGVLLECSEDVASLSELMARDFDTLILTLQPRLVGSATRPPGLERSIHFTLISQEQVGGAFRLTYQRHS